MEDVIVIAHVVAVNHHMHIVSVALEIMACSHLSVRMFDFRAKSSTGRKVTERKAASRKHPRLKGKLFEILQVHVYVIASYIY